MVSFAGGGDSYQCERSGSFRRTCILLKLPFHFYFNTALGAVNLLWAGLHASNTPSTMPVYFFIDQRRPFFSLVLRSPRISSWEVTQHVTTHDFSDPGSNGPPTRSLLRNLQPSVKSPQKIILIAIDDLASIVSMSQIESSVLLRLKGHVSDQSPGLKLRSLASHPERTLRVRSGPTEAG